VALGVQVGKGREKCKERDGGIGAEKQRERGREGTRGRGGRERGRGGDR
jgi:hypothetical protein